MMATKMRKLLSPREWEITLIDRDPVHHYQPGWLLVPFGVDTPQGCVRPKKDFMVHGVNFVLDAIKAVDAEHRKVVCQEGTYDYDWIIVATGPESPLRRFPASRTTGAARSIISTPPTARPPCTTS